MQIEYPALFNVVLFNSLGIKVYDENLSYRNTPDELETIYFIKFIRPTTLGTNIIITHIRKLKPNEL